jgi:hypothetical protein
MIPTQARMAKVYTRRAREAGHLGPYFRLLATTVGTTCTPTRPCGLQACPRCLDDLARSLEWYFDRYREKCERCGHLRFVLRVPKLSPGRDVPGRYVRACSAVSGLTQTRAVSSVFSGRWSGHIGVSYIQAKGEKPDRFRFHVKLFVKLPEKWALDALEKAWREALLVEGLVSPSYDKRPLVVIEQKSWPDERMLDSDSYNILRPVAHMKAIDAYEYLQLLPKLCRVVASADYHGMLDQMKIGNEDVGRHLFTLE